MCSYAPVSPYQEQLGAKGYEDILLPSGEFVKQQNAQCLQCHHLGEGFKYQSTEIHKELACTNCHIDISEFPHLATVEVGQRANKNGFGQVSSARKHFTGASYSCITCHDKEYADFLSDSHGRALFEQANFKAPLCTDCHRRHNPFSKQDLRSRVYPVNIPKTCVRDCHAGIEELVLRDSTASGQVVYESSPEEAYFESGHWKALKYGMVNSAQCVSCHTAHQILGPDAPQSSINMANRIQTCGQKSCHPQTNANFVQAAGHAIPSRHKRAVLFYAKKLFSLLIWTVFSLLAVYISMDAYKRLRKQR
ncbi:MAG: hypothetical protein ACE5HO_04145 [bacterium]